MTGRYLLILCAGLLACGRADAERQESVSVDGLDTARIDFLADSLIRDNNVPSYSIGVVWGDDLVYAKAYDVMNRATGERPNANTLYQIGSITKVFTAVLLGALRDDGVVDLDAPASSYLPADVQVPRQGTREVTLRDLATHTSGFPRSYPNRVNVDPPGGPGVARAYSTVELYEGLRQARLVRSIGEYAYSNMNFGLLGHILERAAGVPYERLLKQRVLIPLGMNDTHIQIPSEDQARFATPYWPSFGPNEPRDPWFWGEIAGAGGLTSTVYDLARFISFQFTGVADDFLEDADRTGADDTGANDRQVDADTMANDRQRGPAQGQRPLSGATVRELWTPQVEYGVNRAIGLGWHLQVMPDNDTLVSHGGEVDGFSSFIGFIPEYSVGIVVLTNFGQNTANELATPMMDIVREWARSGRVRFQ